ncbi:hypothetical protein Q3G72_005456 [Acer saccharum]|nr:hypothetical protein Q3G72_005456 [Acer saccharum]
MNLYALDLSLFDFANFSDPIISHPDRTSSSLISSYDDDNYDDDDDDKSSESKSTQANRRSPPRHRHDGSSPLPLGMDWSSPPRKWDGRDSIWPHDPHTGWSYCVTVPSWILLPNSGGSDPVATYRVQVGIQSPEGITTTRGILRRFSDFLKLLSELKKAFPNKEFPRAPPKRILKMKSRTLLEERRCSLEDWMEKLLSDIDISRSVSVATFLELEAAARSSFHDQETLDAHSLFLFQTNTDASVVAGSSSVASDHGNVSPDGISELGTPRRQTNNSGYFEYQKLDGHVRRLSTESVGSDLSSIRASEISNYGVSNLFGDSSFDHPEDQRLKLNRVLNTMQQRLATAKTDTEDLIARLNQEGAVRQFLTTKVKDLEVELETTRENCKENMQQAVLSEKERITQMQWDIEELRKQCLEMELKLKYEQAERARAESSKMSLVQENEMLLQDLDVARDQLENLHKDHEELEVKLKADVKLLVKEVKSLRSSQSELKQELGRLMKEKLEVERSLQKEKQRAELANNANSKLLHECEILCNRLQECSVNFLSEEEDKLILDTSSPSDAIDLLTTSDNRIGLLLAEAQLLAQDIEKSMAGLGETHSMNDKDQRSDDELRKMLTHIFVDNARLRMHVNSVIRCALNTCVKSDEEDEEEEETPFRKTVLSKFLER